MTIAIMWIGLIFGIRVLSTGLRPFSARLESQARAALLKLISAGTLAILGVRVEVRGARPTPPYFLVSNHLSGLDIFVHSKVLHPIFIAQGDVAKWPVAGSIARAAGTIFIDRERMRDTLRVMQLVQAQLDAGEGVLIYPESTTAEDGHILPFKSALFEVPVQAKLPVYYTSLSYQTPPGAPTALDLVVWRDPVSFVQHFINIASLPRCTAYVVFGESPIAGCDRKVLAQDLQDAVEKGCLPLD